MQNTMPGIPGSLVLVFLEPCRFLLNHQNSLMPCKADPGEHPHHLVTLMKDDYTRDHLVSCQTVACENMNTGLVNSC